MTSMLKIIQPGLMTTLQDLGRVGYQALGIPVSGALDPIALRFANRLVGNPESEAALEILGMGPHFTVAGGVRLALVGGGNLIVNDRPPIAAGASVTVGDGVEVKILGPLAGPAYLSVAGGFDVPMFLGSRSTYPRNNLGGFEGRPLRPRDAIPLSLSAPLPGPERRLAQAWDYAETARVRVVLGPQDDYFTEAAIVQFLEERFTVTKDADRMGLRLDGPALAHSRGFDIVSDGIVNGSIQVPGTGRPIILLADHQSAGGYPKIATVISADLPRLARAVPGTVLTFAAVTVAEAEAARRQLEARFAEHPIENWSGSLPGELDEASLYAENLISGVVDGAAV
ncbi:MAG TPA: biotin-dependent carboxyltransferase family protein [Stellaceae bacterium]|nr:biotin-dependent carboxyltransferase family protein [Stellaceae bacterium]